MRRTSAGWDIRRHASSYTTQRWPPVGSSNADSIHADAHVISTEIKVAYILENFDVSLLDSYGAEYVHLVVEAGKLAFADRDRYLTDPDYAEIPMAHLLSKEYASLLAASIDLDQARPADPQPMGADTDLHGGRRPVGQRGLGHPEPLLRVRLRLRCRRLRVEDRFGDSTASKLSRMGHQVETIDGWSDIAGHAAAIKVDHDNGVLIGAADARGEGIAASW